MEFVVLIAAGVLVAMVAMTAINQSGSNLAGTVGTNYEEASKLTDVKNVLDPPGGGLKPEDPQGDPRSILSQDETPNSGTTPLNTITQPTTDSLPSMSFVAAPPSASYYRVFVSSQSYTGDLGGFLGADARCEQLAAASNLNGNWKAYLVDNDQNIDSRLYPSAVPYRESNGADIANNFTDLIYGNLLTVFNTDENGGIV
ncbi:MAG: hypothetical protein Q7R47_03175, partial [Candidatus Diapherotrites archaeon]|nr:hypothetical protein [Candidatus Diapherotrites archaeon]